MYMETQELGAGGLIRRLFYATRCCKTAYDVPT